MKQPSHTFFWHILSIVSIGVIILGFVIALARIERLSQDIKEQTDINQRYLRCILLLPREIFASDDERVAALDKCAIESRLPSGQPTTPQPTTEDREEFEQNSSVQNRETAPPTSEAAPIDAPKDQTPPPQTSEAPPEEPDNDGIITPEVSVGPVRIPPIHIGSPL